MSPRYMLPALLDQRVEPATVLGSGRDHGRAVVCHGDVADHGSTARADLIGHGVAAARPGDR